jgi:hypothetical protein
MEQISQRSFRHSYTSPGDNADIRKSVSSGRGLPSHEFYMMKFIRGIGTLPLVVRRLVYRGLVHPPCRFSSRFSVSTTVFVCSLSTRATPVHFYLLVLLTSDPSAECGIVIAWTWPMPEGRWPPCLKGIQVRFPRWLLNPNSEVRNLAKI